MRFVSFSILVWIECIKSPDAFSVGIWDEHFVIWLEPIIIWVSETQIGVFIASLHQLTMMQISKKTFQQLYF